jgi:hypothetical protein
MGVYDHYLASQAGFPNDPRDYRAFVEGERAWHAGVGRNTEVLEE